MTLSIKNLSIGLQNVDLVKSVSLELNSDDVLGLLGRNGAGKSLIIKSICDLLPSKILTKSGSIKLDNRILPDIKLFQKGNIAYVPQNFFQYFNPLVKIGKQIEEIVGKENVLKVLANCNLPKKIKDYFLHQISGGMILQILFHSSLLSPSLLLLCLSDESTSTLDFDNRLKLLSHLKNICKERKIPLIMANHDPDIISKYCTKIAVIKSGSIVEFGPLQEIIKNPQHEETKLLIQSCKILPTAKLRRSHNPVLNIKNLVKKYNNQILLDGISIQMKRNVITGITGVRGSGKTTFCKILCGLTKKNGGEVSFSSLENYSSHMIFQNVKGSFNPTLKVREILNEACKSKKKQITLLKEMDLNTQILNRYIENLSGGELQKIAIIRGLLCNPDVLICDEITSSLDVIGQSKVLKILSEVHEKYAIIIIIISHDLKIIKNFCHDKYRLEDGQLKSI